MKSGPILAMIALIGVGLWLVLQPTLSRERADYAVRIGAVELLVKVGDDGRYEFVSPASLADRGPMTRDEYDAAVAQQRTLWNRRPALERTLLGFFNITSWTNFAWVGVGLIGQGAFFGRMFIQWIVSEKSRRSEVPELFWWLSFAGGVCLFTYFVWRVDVVGVLGQSSGVVIYARNIRLIHKQRRREMRLAASADPEPGEAAFPRQDPA